MAIYTRLKDLREDADKTQSDVARYLGTTAQYYGKYEKGERELPFDRAIRLAEYYNVTLDYLAGRSNNKLGQPLTDDTLLPLVCRALIQNGQALPLHPELEVFPSRERVLVFVRPRPLPAGPEQKPTYKLC